MPCRPTIRALTGAIALAVAGVLLAGCGGDGETGTSPTSAPARGPVPPTGETGPAGGAQSFDQISGQELETTSHLVSENGVRVRLKVLKAAWAQTVADRTDKPGEQWLVVSVAVDLDKAAKVNLARLELRTAGGGDDCPGELMLPPSGQLGTCIAVNNALNYAPLVRYQGDWQNEDWKPVYNAPAYRPGQVYVGAAAYGIADNFAPKTFQLCAPAPGVDLGKGPCADLDVPPRG